MSLNVLDTDILTLYYHGDPIVVRNVEREKGKQMENTERPRPRWVRIILREGTKRPTAMSQVAVFALISSIGWIAASNEWGSTSLLGSIGLPLGLLSGLLSVLFALWCWFAIRWVDRHGKWA
jgi:hypothetical protein